MPRTHIDPAVKRLLVTMRQRTSAEHIHDLTDISVRTVQRTMKTYRETGDVVRKPAVSGRPRLLNALDIAYLEALVERQPDLTLDELQKILETDLGLEVSIDTIRRSLISRGLSRKQLSRTAYERDEEDRAEFQRIVGMFYHANQLVCVDECAANRQTPDRKYGWAPFGDRARCRSYSIRGKNYSILPAIALGAGVLHCNIYDTPVTSRLFNDFIEGLLDEMSPFPGPRSVIVMDNASIHKSVALREMVEARGMRILFLPSYSPDFNPIENAFSSIKAYLRRHRDLALYELGNGPYVNPWAILYEAVFSVTPDDVHGWYRNCSYVV